MNVINSARYRSLKLLKQFSNKEYIPSYSQTGEDIIVNFIFKCILNIKNFNYCDIGAHHPTNLSNTALFYKSGMHGICVEPDPDLYKLIQKKRSKDICLNIGISINEDIENKYLDFYFMSARTLNTFSKEEAERLDRDGQYKIVDVKKIKVIHIHEVFTKYFLPDFLSLDVEGLDYDIIKSIDLLKYRPKVICVETAEFSPIPPGKKDYTITNYLLERDYMVYADTFNNSILIDDIFLKKITKNDFS